MTVRRGLWLGLWSVILPVVLYFLLVVTFGLDKLDLSSTGGNTILVVAAGVLAGLIVGIGFGMRDWRILIPPLAAGLIGLGLYPLLESVDNTTPAYVVVWLGQSAAMCTSVGLSSPGSVPGRSDTD